MKRRVIWQIGSTFWDLPDTSRLQHISRPFGTYPKHRDATAKIKDRNVDTLKAVT